jgi:sensor histidine kinase regulating citrate/malate metabolism
MKHKNYSNASDQPSRDKEKDEPEYYIWSTSEKSKLRALSLYIIRSIVERHRGSIEIDLATDIINIDLPDEEKVACAQEMEEQVGTMCY